VSKRAKEIRRVLISEELLVRSTVTGEQIGTIEDRQCAPPPTPTPYSPEYVVE
jgi:hypothetical protein